MGLVPWSPLAGGFLTGKYTRTETNTASGDGRYSRFELFANRQHGEDRWNTLDLLLKTATEAGCTPAQAALNWVVNRPTVTSTIITGSSSTGPAVATAAFTAMPPAILKAISDESTGWCLPS